jgi:hypothetical protein
VGEIGELLEQRLRRRAHGLAIAANALARALGLLGEEAVQVGRVNFVNPWIVAQFGVV